MVQERLGELALLETANEGRRRELYRREAGTPYLHVPWPVLRLNEHGPGRAAQIAIFDGAHHVTTRYDEEGRWREASRSAGPGLPGVLGSLLAGGALPVEVLADHVSEMDVGRHGPARVHRPVPVPGGIILVMSIALDALREALFERRVPDEARVVVADGFTGAAIGWGRDEAEAMEHWRSQVKTIRPEREPPPSPLPNDESEDPLADDPGFRMLDVKDGFGFQGKITMRGPTSDVPMPEPSVANTPALIVSVPPVPDPHPWGTWLRHLGPEGQPIHLLHHRDDEGFLLVGERVVERCGVDRLHETLADVTIPPMGEVPPEVQAMREKHPVFYASEAIACRLVDPETDQTTKPRYLGRWMAEGFDARHLNNWQPAYSVIRQRRLI